MDELPDLRSDTDVDALMARLRARIDAGPATAPARASERTAVSLPDGLNELLAAQEAFASTVLLAMELIVATLEEVAGEDGAAAASRPARRPVARRRSR